MKPSILALSAAVLAVVSTTATATAANAYEYSKYVNCSLGYQVAAYTSATGTTGTVSSRAGTHSDSTTFMFSGSAYAESGTRSAKATNMVFGGIFMGNPVEATVNESERYCTVYA